MPWWTWIAAGALLLVAEVVLPTDFFLVFFGAAGLVVGLAMLLGLHPPAWAQWLLFAALSIVSLVVLRCKEPTVSRPFRVPLYPLTPLLFSATAAYLLYASLAYAGTGVLVGLGVLAVGGGVLILSKGREAEGGT